MECDGWTTIGVRSSTKEQFLEEIIGKPKRFASADDAILALIAKWKESGGDGRSGVL